MLRDKNLIVPYLDDDNPRNSKRRFLGHVEFNVVLDCHDGGILGGRQFWARR